MLTSFVARRGASVCCVERKKTQCLLGGKRKREKDRIHVSGLVKESHEVKGGRGGRRRRCGRKLRNPHRGGATEFLMELRKECLQFSTAPVGRAKGNEVRRHSRPLAAQPHRHAAYDSHRRSDTPLKNASFKLI